MNVAKGGGPSGCAGWLPMLKRRLLRSCRRRSYSAYCASIASSAAIVSSMPSSSSALRASSSPSSTSAHFKYLQAVNAQSVRTVSWLTPTVSQDQHIRVNVSNQGRV